MAQIHLVERSSSCCGEEESRPRQGMLDCLGMWQGQVSFQEAIWPVGLVRVASEHLQVASMQSQEAAHSIGFVQTRRGGQGIEVPKDS